MRRAGKRRRRILCIFRHSQTGKHMSTKNQAMELFHRYEGNPILTASHWPYRANTVFNAGATLLQNGETLLLVRVEDRRGISHLTAARSRDGKTQRVIDSLPTFVPDPHNHPEELWSTEDP